jgi:hypothetical protein
LKFRWDHRRIWLTERRSFSLPARLIILAMGSLLRHLSILQMDACSQQDWAISIWDWKLKIWDHPHKAVHYAKGKCLLSMMFSRKFSAIDMHSIYTSNSCQGGKLNLINETVQLIQSLML